MNEIVLISNIRDGLHALRKARGLCPTHALRVDSVCVVGKEWQLGHGLGCRLYRSTFYICLPFLTFQRLPF
jgi:hypothetical protein